MIESYVLVALTYGHLNDFALPVNTMEEQDMGVHKEETE